MKGYGQFCPVAKASEIIGERWTPLVLRELVCGSRRFNGLPRWLGRSVFAEVQVPAATRRQRSAYG